MIRKPLLLVVLLMLLCTTALGQGKTGPAHQHWEFSVFGGASFLGEHAYVTPVAGSATETSRVVGLRYATGTQMGVRFTENRGDRWGAAIEYSFANQPVTFSNLSTSLPSYSPGHSVHRIGYDVLYFAAGRTRRLRPYVLGGAGMALFALNRNSTPDGSLKTSNPWKFAVNFGGGVKYLLWDQVGFSIQYSNSITSAPGYGLPEEGRYSGSEYVPGMKPDGHLFNSLISVGFVYQWDRP